MAAGSCTIPTCQRAVDQWAAVKRGPPAVKGWVTEAKRRSDYVRVLLLGPGVQIELLKVADHPTEQPAAGGSA
jgi:hypothetical protein